MSCRQDLVEDLIEESVPSVADVRAELLALSDEELLCLVDFLEDAGYFEEEESISDLVDRQ